MTAAFVVFCFIYLIPTFFALFNDRKENKAPAIVVNIFLGWTFIGWVVAFAMAVSSDKKKCKE